LTQGSHSRIGLDPHAGVEIPKIFSPKFSAPSPNPGIFSPNMTQDVRNGSLQCLFKLANSFFGDIA
ncbi:MAG TPA: hypothetical protein PLL06_17965, partial [Acidobacteriota bacterium]|nr:hypothetical protein [Acidobacteriota bacterium]